MNKVPIARFDELEDRKPRYALVPPAVTTVNPNTVMHCLPVWFAERSTYAAVTPAKSRGGSLRSERVALGARLRGHDVERDRSSSGMTR